MDSLAGEGGWAYERASLGWTCGRMFPRWVGSGETVSRRSDSAGRRKASLARTCGGGEGVEGPRGGLAGVKAGHRVITGHGAGLLSGEGAGCGRRCEFGQVRHASGHAQQQEVVEQRGQEAQVLRLVHVYCGPPLAEQRHHSLHPLRPAPRSLPATVGPFGPLGTLVAAASQQWGRRRGGQQDPQHAVQSPAQQRNHGTVVLDRRARIGLGSCDVLVLRNTGEGEVGTSSSTWVKG